RTDIILCNHDVLNPVVCRLSPLHKVEETAQCQKRPDHHAEICCECHQLSDGNCFIYNHPGTKQDGQEVTHPNYRHDRRIEQCIHFRHSQILLDNFVTQAAETFTVALLITESFRHFDACDTFLCLVIQTAECRLRLLESPIE